MKIKYLLVSLVVLFVPLLVGANLTESQETEFCGGICPRIIIKTEVINDQSGTLTPDNFYYRFGNFNVSGDETTRSGDGWGHYPAKGLFRLERTYTLWSSTKTPPFSYKVSVEAMYGSSPYLSENGGSIVYSEDCEGAINFGDVKTCYITINDGILVEPVYGYRYDELSPGHYKEMKLPLSTPCTYKNRAQMSGDEMIKAPLASPEDNVDVIGCFIPITMEQIRQREEVRKEEERQAMLRQIKQEVKNEIATSTVAIQEVPVITQLQEVIQQQVATTTATTTPVLSQDEKIEQLKAQIADIQRQIIVLLTELIRILQGQLASR